MRGRKSGSKAEFVRKLIANVYAGWRKTQARKIKNVSAPKVLAMNSDEAMWREREGRDRQV